MRRCARHLLERAHRARGRRPDRGRSATSSSASFGDVGVLSDTLVKATPLIFTGLACASRSGCACGTSAPRASCSWGRWGASPWCWCRSCRRARRPSCHPRDGRGGAAAGALWGGSGWLAQGPLRRERDHHHPDAQLHRASCGSGSGCSVPGARAASSCSKQFPREAWLPRLTDFATLNPDLGGPDRPPGLRLRHRVRRARVVPGRPGRARATRSGSSATTPARRATRASTSAATSSW